MLTVKEASEILGVSSALIYSLCAAHKLRHERHGLGRGTIRIPEDALEEYRSHQTVPVSGEVKASLPAPKPGQLKLEHITL